MKNDVKYSVSLNFEEIRLLLFKKILILGKNSPHGKQGISKYFELLIQRDLKLLIPIMVILIAYLSISEF